jgi:transcriptional regulator with XRE-family HTH domain
VPRLDVSTLGQYIREQRDQAQLSLRQLAAQSGVSNPYLSQVERGLRRPSAEILGRLASALRISAETLYVRAGILEDRVGDATTLEAIAADVTITERQRRVLLEIYAAFQAENRENAAGDSTTPEPSADDPAEHTTKEVADDPAASHERSTP